MKHNAPRGAPVVYHSYHRYTTYLIIPARISSYQIAVLYCKTTETNKAQLVSITDPPVTFVSV